MPAEEKDEGSLQDLLRDLLASAPQEAATAPPGEETEAVEEAEQPTQEGEAPSQPQPAPWEEKPSGEVTPPPPTLEVEIIPPEVAPPAVGAEAATAPPAPAQPQAEVEETLLEGKVEVRVAPPVPPAHLSLLERALRERPDLLWLGTWGKPKEGVTLHLYLNAPVAAGRLFQGIGLVERVEVAKAGKAWRLQVVLARDGGQVTQEAAPPVTPPQPAAPQPSAPAEASPAAQLPSAPGKAAGGPIDLEASPIASLEALNRFERLLSSLGCRTINVLSLDGVSTVLVTLEGIDRETLAQKLQGKVSGIQVEVSQGRLIARLPEKW